MNVSFLPRLSKFSCYTVFPDDFQKPFLICCVLNASKYLSPPGPSRLIMMNIPQCTQIFLHTMTPPLIKELIETHSTTPHLQHMIKVAILLEVLKGQLMLSFFRYFSLVSSFPKMVLVSPSFLPSLPAPTFSP